MKRWKLAAIAGGGAALVGAVALAVWIIITITTVGPSTFNTGVATGASSLALRDNTCVTAKTRDIWPVMTGAQPGALVSGEVCACNDAGGSPLIFAITSTNTNAVLSAGLVARVTVTGIVAGSSPPACQSPSLNTDGSRVASVTQDELYFGPLAGLKAGDPLAGRQTGDQALDGGGFCERVCVTVALPLAAGAELSSLNNDTDVLFHHQQQ